MVLFHFFRPVKLGIPMPASISLRDRIVRIDLAIKHNSGFLHDGFLIPGFCLLIYGLACNGWPASMLSGRTMQLLADASYSVYMIALSILLFKYVETPARIYLRSRLSYRRPEASGYVPDSLRRADARSS